jgi:hypothetical protein
MFPPLAGADLQKLCPGRHRPLPQRLVRQSAPTPVIRVPSGRWRRVFSIAYVCWHRSYVRRDASHKIGAGASCCLIGSTMVFPAGGCRHVVGCAVAAGGGGAAGAPLAPSLRPRRVAAVAGGLHGPRVPGAGQRQPRYVQHSDGPRWVPPPDARLLFTPPVVVVPSQPPTSHPLLICNGYPVR